MRIKLGHNCQLLTIIIVVGYISILGIPKSRAGRQDCLARPLGRGYYAKPVDFPMFFLTGQIFPCQVFMVPSRFSINTSQPPLFIAPYIHVDVVLGNTLTLNHIFLPPHHEQTSTSAITFIDDEVITSQSSLQFFCLSISQMCFRQRKHILSLLLLDIQKCTNCPDTGKALAVPS